MNTIHFIYQAAVTTVPIPFWIIWISMFSIGRTLAGVIGLVWDVIQASRGNYKRKYLP